MNAQQIIDKFESMVGDSLDPDFTLQLANDAKDEVEQDVSPEGLKAVDASASTAVGQTYATGIALPADFYLPERRIYVGDTPHYQVPLERAVEYRGTAGFFYIDNANGTYHLCGTQTAVQAITFPYRYATADLVLTPTPTSPTWPPKFHSLIPMKMAELYFPIDGGERGRSWDDKWERLYARGLRRFRDYDSRLKLAAMDRGSSSMDGATGGEDRINLDT